MPTPDSRSMISDEVASEVVNLGLIRSSSTVTALRRIADLSARAVPGCAGATCVRWHPGNPPEPDLTAASHPDLAEIVDLQLTLGEGPVLDALHQRTTVICDDTLAEARWPHCVPALLRRGVRSLQTTVYESDNALVTLTMYGALPGALDDGASALVTMLIEQSGAAVSNTARYHDMQRTAVQLQEAVAARAVVDQAKGILMHALGYDADEAFAELRRMSQTRHVKLTALARRIVSGQRLENETSQRSPQDRRR